jgi:hypothetical protein
LRPVSRHPRIPSGTWGNSFLLENILRFSIRRDSDAYWRHNLFGPSSTRFRRLLRLRLTSARSSRRLSTLGSTVANVQISQGNSRDLPAYACRIYVTAFRASIGLWQFWLPCPAAPPNPLPVRQASILPRASFRFAVARDTLASG